MHLPALDSDAWAAFLGTFLEGFPDLHLEVQDTVADEEMNAQRILFTGTHTGHFRGLPPTGRKPARGSHWGGAASSPRHRKASGAGYLALLLATSTSLVKARLTPTFGLARVWADRDGVGAYVLRT
jgi:hypothetical protein